MESVQWEMGEPVEYYEECKAVTKRRKEAPSASFPTVRIPLAFISRQLASRLSMTENQVRHWLSRTGDARSVSLCLYPHTVYQSPERSTACHVREEWGKERRNRCGFFTLLSWNTSGKVCTTACSRKASQMWRTDVRLHLYFFSFNISPDELLCSINFAKPRHVQFQILITDTCLCSVPNTYHG